MGKAVSLAGRRFGKLTVLSPTDKRMDSGSIVWRCQCDCGNVVEVSARRLIRKKVRSCGCLSNPPHKDYIGKRFGRLTVTEYAGTAKELGKTGTANYWKCICDCGNETVVSQTELQSGGTRSCGCLQRELAAERLELIEGTSVAILERNKQVRRTNKSGYTGVYHAADGKWVAYINFKKKRYWLGRYDDKESAIKARQRGEEMHEDFLEWYHTAYSKPSVNE